MSFLQLKYKFYLYRCRKTDSEKLFLKTYMLSTSLDVNKEIEVIGKCTDYLAIIHHNLKLDFSNRIYDAVIYYLKRTNKTFDYSNNEEFLNAIIDFLIEAKNYNLLFSILSTGLDIHQIKNNYDNPYMITNKNIIKKIVKAVFEGEMLNIKKQLFLAQNYREYISIKKLEDIVCYFKIPYYIYMLALSIDGVDIKLLEDTLIKTNDIDFIYKFAFIKGSDIQKIENYIINTKNNDYIIKLFNIPGCDSKKIEEYIFESNDSNLVYNYMIKYNYDINALLKIIELHDYDILYKLRTNKKVILNKEICKIIDKELYNSNNELYECFSIIENEEYINQIFGCKDNMLLFLANKYCEEKKPKWMRLYNKLKTTMDDGIVKDYLKIKKIGIK